MTDHDDTDTGFDRRTVIKTAAASALGLAASGTASAHEFSGSSSSSTSTSGDHDHTDPSQHTDSENVEKLDYHSLGGVGTSSNAGRPEEPHYGAITEIRTHGDFAYVGFFSSDDPTNDRGMAILDISDFTDAESFSELRNAELTVLSFVRNDDPASAVMDVKVSADGKYVFLSKQPYTALFNETDPTPGDEGESNSATAGSVTAVDVSDKGNPEVVGAYTAWTTGSHNATYHRIGGEDYVFACKDLNDGTAGLYVLHFDRTTGQFTLENRWTLDGDGGAGTGGTLYIHDITVQDDPRTGKPTGYLSYWDQGLRVLDLSDPANIEEIGWFDMDASHYAEPAPVLMNGKRVVVAGQEVSSVSDGSSGKVYLVDADGLDDGYDGSPNLVELDQWELLSNTSFDNFTLSPHNFDVTEDGWVHLAHYHGGVRYLEIDTEDWLLRHQGYYLPHEDVPEDSKMQGLNSAAPFTWGAVERDGITFAADINSGVYALRHEYIPFNADGGSYVTAERSDDGSVFTGGQTNRIDLTIAADTEARVRDEIPAEWTVIGGDPVSTETVNGRTTVEFDSPTDGGELTYFVEAPTGLAETASYSFGPVSVSTDDGASWTEVPDTTEDNTVLGASSASLGALGVIGAGSAGYRVRNRLLGLLPGDRGSSDPAEVLDEDLREDLDATTVTDPVETRE
ncbi:LVIVD repeat-containing protein [Haloarchaeobius sp. TZWWS8]|uniref:LVIVD repeat-containing protein n=1 Tax=Haloarchaeobius sp. TZWWS8 TaxID=3446121 RepID=UPI003EC085BA